MKRVVVPTRRGVALLLVLATLVLVGTTSVSLFQTAVTTRVARHFARDTVAAGDLLAVAEAPILHWLQASSADVVLASDVETPRVAILHDAWQIDGVEYELRINAWDQCGMVPLTMARSGSPLRLCLPASVRRILDRTDLPRDQPPGLDLFLIEHRPGPRVFPAPGLSQPTRFGVGGVPTAEPARQSAPVPDPAAPAAVGAHVATHGQHRINVNTAAGDLVEAALRAAGRGGTDAILAAREEGRAFSAGDLAVQRKPDRGAPRIVGASNAWAVRIDVRVGATQRAWWAVYSLGGSNGWECVQRLAIPE